MPGGFQTRGVSRIVLTPAVADTSAPTRAEINAGTVIAEPGRVNDEKVVDFGGWQFQNNPIVTAHLDDTFDEAIPGNDSVPTPPFFVITASKGVRTVRDTMAKDSIHYALLMIDGDVEAYPMQVWRVQVASNNDEPKLANERHSYRVVFSTLERPVLDAVVPAA